MEIEVHKQDLVYKPLQFVVRVFDRLASPVSISVQICVFIGLGVVYNIDAQRELSGQVLFTDMIWFEKWSIVLFLAYFLSAGLYLNKVLRNFAFISRFLIGLAVYLLLLSSGFYNLDQTYRGNSIYASLAVIVLLAGLGLSFVSLFKQLFLPGKDDLTLLTTRRFTFSKLVKNAHIISYKILYKILFYAVITPAIITVIFKYFDEPDFDCLIELIPGVGNPYVCLLHQLSFMLANAISGIALLGPGLFFLVLAFEPGFNRLFGKSGKLEF